jgi:hypothetical protein
MSVKTAREMVATRRVVELRNRRKIGGWNRWVDIVRREMGGYRGLSERGVALVCFGKFSDGGKIDMCLSWGQFCKIARALL